MSLFDHLLIIDDNDATNNFHRRLIEKMNVFEEVIIFKNGKDGLDHFRSMDVKPELIFLDLNMPVMNGFEFLGVISTLLSDEEQQKLHIVVLSSSDEVKDEDRCKELYPNISFSPKPLTKQIIDEIVGKISG